MLGAGAHAYERDLHLILTAFLCGAAASRRRGLLKKWKRFIVRDLIKIKVSFFQGRRDPPPRLIDPNQSCQ